MLKQYPYRYFSAYLSIQTGRYRVLGAISAVHFLLYAFSALVIYFLISVKSRKKLLCTLSFGFENPENSMMQNKTGHNAMILFLNIRSCDLQLESFKIQDVSESKVPVHA
jgi:hypothetical protein